MKKLVLLSLVFVVASVQASLAPIVAHSVEIRPGLGKHSFKHGMGIGVFLGIESPIDGRIVFLSRGGGEIAEYPIHMQAISGGLTALAALWDNEAFPLHRTNGKAVEDILGRYYGAKAALALLLTGGRTELVVNRNFVFMTSNVEVQMGGGLDLSALEIQVTKQGGSDEEWQRTIVLE